MKKALAILLLCAAGAACVPGPSMADHAGRIRGIVWIQPALGLSTGDDLVSGQVNANIGVSGIPYIGPIGVTIPVRAEVTFEDPMGMLAGGELGVGRFGFEVNAIYLPKAATARGRVRVCGGILTATQCALIRQFAPWLPIASMPDYLVVEQELKNVAVSAGANYHFIAGRRWNIWAGPMIAWSAWDEYDFSDVRVDLSTSMERLLAGEVDDFELAGTSRIAPQNGLTFGGNVGGRFDFARRWSLLGQFRYFAGDDVVLPGGSGRYSAAGFSVGLAHRFGG